MPRTLVPAHATTSTAAPRRASARAIPRGVGLGIAVAVLLGVMLLSVAVGAKALPLGDVLHGLLHDDGSERSDIVRDLRVPRTVVGLAVGVALGLAGVLMQAITRNPLADPGILGVEAGAAAAVVLSIGLLGVSSVTAQVPFAFAGAALASVAVYALGARSHPGASPVHLALAGAAIYATLSALIQGVMLLDPHAFETFRFWRVGSLNGRGFEVLLPTLPFLAAGALVALALARPLNALALGDEAGRALGAHVGRTRALTALAIVLLCGGATAVAGPIAFVGLTIPHVARAIVGPDQRWVMPYALVLGPILVLAADVVGRIVVRPGELEAGIVTAAIGAPLFIALVRRRRVAQL